MKKALTFIFILFIFSALHGGIDTTRCNWKSRISRFDVYNNCDSHKNAVHIIGKITLNQNYNCKAPARRTWKLSGNNTTIIGSGENLYYQVTKNGTYTICVSILDSCNKCDTVLCKTVTVSCLGCNWKSKIDSFAVKSNCDSNKNNKHIIGKIALNQNYNCSKMVFRQWSVNKAIVGYGQNLYHQVFNNGTYAVCITLYDSCRKCDTMICKNVTVNCFPGCNWKSKIDTFSVMGHCDSLKRTKAIYASLSLNQNYKCNKYALKKWLVNNTVAGYGSQLHYPVSNNGSYQVCVVLYDSCNNCDTSLCRTVTINCGAPPKCNWKNMIDVFDARGVCDSLKRTKTIQAKLYLNHNYKCAKKAWKKWLVNNTVAGYGDQLYYSVNSNGTYQVCVVVYDSCNHCDTSLCKTVTINCGPSKCNWHSRIDAFNVTGHCDTAKRTRAIYGSFYLNQNYQCAKKPLKKWFVNNVVAGYGDALHYPLSADGTYQVCVVVYDSCDKCDTTLCKSVTVNCKTGPRCEWKSKLGGFDVRTNCDSNLHTVNIIGKFYLNQNYKCHKKLFRKWTVNNTVAGYGEKLYYQVRKNGTYKVCMIVYDSCNNCDTSFCKTLQVNCRNLGIDEETLTAGVKLYPNPAGDIAALTFEQEVPEKVNVSIVDLSGRVVMNETSIHVAGYSADLRVSQLPAGMYIVRVDYEGRRLYLRMLKE